MKPSAVTIEYTTIEAPLSREELVQVLGTALDGQPKLAAALRQVLQYRLALATAEAATRTLTERGAGHAGGRLEELIGLQTELRNYAAAAQELRTAARGNSRRAAPR